mgnify:CR=1 FL=1
MGCGVARGGCVTCVGGAGVPFPGTCAAGVTAGKVSSGRGSEFLLGVLAAVDPRFVKYPPLPVREGEGFLAAAAADERTTH